MKMLAYFVLLIVTAIVIFTALVINKKTQIDTPASSPYSEDQTVEIIFKNELQSN